MATHSSPVLTHLIFFYIFFKTWNETFSYHKIQLTIEQDSYPKANESGEEAQKEAMGLIDIGLPQSKK